MSPPSRVENLDGDELRGLRDTVAGTSGNTRNVRTVTVVIELSETGTGPAKDGAATEVVLSLRGTFGQVWYLGSRCSHVRG